MNFNQLARRSGLADFVEKMNTGAESNAQADASAMIGIVVKWFVRLIALVVAFDALGLPAVSDVLRQLLLWLLLWLPNVVVAVVVMVIGGRRTTTPARSSAPLMRWSGVSNPPAE